MSPGDIIAVMVIGGSIVGAFVTVQVVLKTHLKDCAEYRKLQSESMKEFAKVLRDISEQLNRLIGRMELEQRRERN